MVIDQDLMELKTMLDAKIDKFLETQGMSENNACLLGLKAMLDAKFDAFSSQNGRPRTGVQGAGSS
jgi:hypothetical protein